MIYNPNKLQKIAFSPFTEDAQMAAQQAPMPQQGGMPPMDPAMMSGQPPMDPTTAQGGMPPQGTPAPIQTVPGPNGEPIDPETGFIVIDPQQGLEQDPMTGIIFNKFTQEFMTPDGQPMDPNQAIQMIEQSMAQAGGQAIPSMGGQDMSQPPMDPAMAQGGIPQEQAAAQAPQGAGQTFDPATGQMIDDATGMLVDSTSGMLIDPSTGQMIDPNSGAVALGAQQMPMFDDPEIVAQVQDAVKEVPAMAKELARIEKNDNRLRTDIQGLRREIQTLNDNQDALLSRLENTTNLIEQLLGAR